MRGKCWSLTAAGGRLPFFPAEIHVCLFVCLHFHIYSGRVTAAVSEASLGSSLVWVLSHSNVIAACLEAVRLKTRSSRPACCGAAVPQ